MTRKLEILMEVECDDDNLADVFYTKIQLNWEIDKDEAKGKSELVKKR